MIDNILQIAAPHLCSECGKTGRLLCDNCKYDIVSDGFSGCIICTAPAQNGICRQCLTTYDKAWCVAERRDGLRQLIDLYKFERAKAAHKVIAALIHESLPILPSNRVIVPVPTVPQHIRQRGYDHSWLVAKRFAYLRSLPVAPLLSRQTTTKQRGATRRERFAQAEAAYVCNSALDATVPYLVIDDIVTTGASLQLAAKALRDAGAETVWVAVTARQSIDKQK